MIDKQIEIIFAKVRQTQSIPDQAKVELLDLLSNLKEEVASLSQTHADTAQSIASFASVSAHEGTRAERKPELLESALKGLSDSVQELETSHPKLVDTVNRITVVLSNMGI